LKGGGNLGEADDEGIIFLNFKEHKSVKTLIDTFLHELWHVIGTDEELDARVFAKKYMKRKGIYVKVLEKIVEDCLL